MASKAPANNGKTDWVGTNDADIYGGGNGKDMLDGLGGDDILNGNNGKDLVEGGDDDDTLYGDNGIDMLSGGLGNDTLYGGRGNDMLDGGDGDDELTGGTGADVFVLSDGNDTITDFSPLENVLIDFEAALTGADEPDYAANVIADGYANLDWTSAWVMDPSVFYHGGYEQVLESGVAVGYDGFGVGLSFSDPNRDFDFQSGYFASAWATQSVTFTAYDDGEAVGSATFSLGQTKTFIDFSTAVEVTGRFTSVDTISVDGLGTYEGDPLSHVAMDDLTLSYGEGDLIDVADGTDIAALIASAVSDGMGGATLSHDGGSLTLVGIAPEDVSADWFV